MFRVASRNDGDDLSDGLRGLGSGPLFSEGMPYGVRLDKDHLRAIVGTLAEEPDDLEPALVGLFQANNMAIATGLDRAAAEYGTGDAARRFWGNQRDLFSPAITSAGEATAWLLEAGHGGARADEAARATQAELVARALSTASSLPFIPDIPDETAKWFVDQGRSAAIDAVESTPATATGRFSAADASARAALEASVLDLLWRAGYLSPDVAEAQRFASTPPPAEAMILDADGRPIGIDHDSPAFIAWYEATPMRSILTEAVINTYASSWGSVR